MFELNISILILAKLIHQHGQLCDQHIEEAKNETNQLSPLVPQNLKCHRNILICFHFSLLREAFLSFIFFVFSLFLSIFFICPLASSFVSSPSLSGEITLLLVYHLTPSPTHQLYEQNVWIRVQIQNSYPQIYTY